jgi:hypothetical protein
VLAAVDERHLVLVHGVQDELDADEAEQDRQADRQVHQALEQAADEEVQLPQPHQGEQVGREHQVGLLGQTEDGGDRVQREQQVGGAQGEDDDEHRRDDALAVDPRDELGACVPGLGGREAALDEAEEAVLLVLLVPVAHALARELDGRVEQERAEQVEDPGELLDGSGARRR